MKVGPAVLKPTKSMKTILIERVSNGWIVRPFTPEPVWSQMDLGVIAVYVRMEDLQADLPRLVEWQPVKPNADSADSTK